MRCAIKNFNCYLFKRNVIDLTDFIDFMVGFRSIAKVVRGLGQAVWRLSHAAQCGAAEAAADILERTWAWNARYAGTRV